MWRGHNPCCSDAPALYAAHLHIAEQGVNESPPILVLTTPFLLFSPRAALMLYSATQYLLVLWGALVLAPLLPRAYRIALLSAMIASPATFLVCYYGQTGAIVFICAAFALRARTTENWTVLGLCIAASLVKPQIGICAVAPFLWGAPREAWKAFAAGVATLIGITCDLLGADGAWAYVQTLCRFSTSAHSQASADGLGISSLYGGWLKGPAITWTGAGLTVLLLLFAGTLILLWRNAPSNATLASLALLATLLSPYSHQYDSIAIFPALVLAIAADKATTPCGLPRQDSRRTTRVALPAVERATVWTGIGIMLVSPFMAISAISFPFRLYPLGIILVLAALGVDMTKRRIRPRVPALSGSVA